MRHADKISPGPGPGQEENWSTTRAAGDGACLILTDPARMVLAQPPADEQVPVASGLLRRWSTSPLLAAITSFAGSGQGISNRAGTHQQVTAAASREAGRWVRGPPARRPM